jgi:hypothetical protein
LTPGPAVSVVLPEVLGHAVDRFASLSANRVLLLIEDLMVYAMQRCRRLPIEVVEIAVASRDPHFPKRFRLAIPGIDASTPWVISFTDKREFV